MGKMLDYTDSGSRRRQEKGSNGLPEQSRVEFSHSRRTSCVVSLNKMPVDLHMPHFVAQMRTINCQVAWLDLVRRQLNTAARDFQRALFQSQHHPKHERKPIRPLCHLPEQQLSKSWQPHDCIFRLVIQTGFAKPIQLPPPASMFLLFRNEMLQALDELVTCGRAARGECGQHAGNECRFKKCDQLAETQRRQLVIAPLLRFRQLVVYRRIVQRRECWANIPAAAIDRSDEVKLVFGLVVFMKPAR